MGLDGVELLMATEERFGIYIEDVEAGRVRTVGDLEALVIRKLAEQDAAVCRMQRAFHLLRRNAIEQFGIERSAFTPDTELEKIVPRANRPALWGDYCVSVGVPASHMSWFRNSPALTLPPTLKTFWMLSLPIFVMISFLFGAASPLGALFLGVVCFAVLAYALRPFRTEFPVSIQTVSSLVSFVALNGSKHTEKELASIKSEDVYPLLSQVICEQLGIKEEEFTRNSSFVDDLGVD